MIGKTNAKNAAYKMTVISGVLPSSAAWTSYYNYPEGWTDIDKIIVLPLEIYMTGGYGWRSWQGSDGTSYTRYFIGKDQTGVRVYNTSSVWYNHQFRFGLIYMG